MQGTADIVQGTVDINNLNLRNEVIETDQVSAEDFFKRVAPIDDGEHLMTAKLAQRGIEIKPGKTKNGVKSPAFFMVNIQFTDTEDNGRVCFDNPNSVVFVTRDGKRTSRLHVFMEAIGDPVPSSTTLEDLKEQVERALAQNPQVYVTTRWEAQYEDPTVAKDSPDRYVVFRTGQKNFYPERDESGQETGRYLPDITDPKTGKEGTARAQVKSYRKV